MRRIHGSHVCWYSSSWRDSTLAYVLLSVGAPSMYDGTPNIRAIWFSEIREKSAAPTSTGDQVSGWNSVVAFSTAMERRPPCWAIHLSFNAWACSAVMFGVDVFR